MEPNKFTEEGLAEGREEGPEEDVCAIIRELSRDIAALADKPDVYNYTTQSVYNSICMHRVEVTVT